MAAAGALHGRLLPNRQSQRLEKFLVTSWGTSGTSLPQQFPSDNNGPKSPIVLIFLRSILYHKHLHTHSIPNNRNHVCSVFPGYRQGGERCTCDATRRNLAAGARGGLRRSGISRELAQQWRARQMANSALLAPQQGLLPPLCWHPRGEEQHPQQCRLQGHWQEQP